MPTYSQGSVFGTPEEAINYTIQHTLQTGIKADLIGNLVKDFQKKSRRDLKKKIPKDKIVALQQFKDLFS